MRRVGAVLLVALAGSCARVKPYQRERLASPVMASESTRAEEKVDAHVAEYREGSVGGGSVGGGGCGCN